jgi:hypothetical protein
MVLLIFFIDPYQMMFVLFYTTYGQFFKLSSQYAVIINLMKGTSFIVVFLIVFSLSIQNTCPFGQTGKTGFISGKVHHCPLKESAHKNKDQRHNPLQHTGQTFTFVVPVSPSYLCRPFRRPLLASLDESPYHNIFKDPPLKPPRFYHIQEV